MIHLRIIQTFNIFESLVHSEQQKNKFIGFYVNQKNSCDELEIQTPTNRHKFILGIQIQTLESQKVMKRKR